MAWETRQRGDRYYTRSFRVNGIVVRKYIGSGVHAERCAAQDERAKEKRDEAKARLDAVRAELDLIELAVSEYNTAVTTIATATLHAAGYHQHDRGPWRKRKESMQTNLIESTDTVNELQTYLAQNNAIIAGLTAKPGSPDRKKALDCLEQQRDASHVESYGTFSNGLLDLVAYGCSEVARKYLELEFDRDCLKLAGSEASPLEKLLIERVIVTKKQLAYIEEVFAQKQHKNPSIPVAIYFQKSIGMAQKRYLSAIKALAQVRRLQLPANIQVNIGEKQVNIAGVTSGAIENEHNNAIPLR